MALLYYDNFVGTAGTSSDTTSTSLTRATEPMWRAQPAGGTDVWAQVDKVYRQLRAQEREQALLAVVPGL